MGNFEVSVNNGNGGGRKYFVDPKPGMYNAVCVDFIDHGFSINNYGKVLRKVQPVFQLGDVITEKRVLAAKKAAGLPEEIEDADIDLIGKRLMIRGKKMSFSLYPGGDNMKASDLYGFLSDWGGVKLPKGTQANPHTEDLETWIGRPATLLLSAKADANDPNRKYINVSSVMPFDEETYDAPLALDGTYIRVQDRDNYTAPPSRAEVEGGGSLQATPTSNVRRIEAAKSATEAEVSSDVEPEIPWDKAA
jgi:hypothetical protein